MHLIINVIIKTTQLYLFCFALHSIVLFN